MPKPTISQVHVDRILTNLSILFTQQNTQWVAPFVFPIVPVEHQSGLYYKYPRGDWMRPQAKLRAPGTESAGSGYQITTDTYTAAVYAFHKDVDDQTRANSDPEIDLDAGATRFVNLALMLTREQDWLNSYFKAGVWATDNSSVTNWDDSLSDPQKDIKDARRYVQSQTGYMPNTLTVSRAVHDALTLNPLIRDQYKYTTAESITDTVLARLFEVDRYLVTDVVINSGAEGGADSYNFLAGKHALLSYSPPAAALNVPSAGYIFAWTGYLGAGFGAPQISTWRMDEIKSDRVEGEMTWGMKVVASELGYFFPDVVS